MDQLALGIDRKPGLAQPVEGGRVGGGQSVRAIGAGPVRSGAVRIELTHLVRPERECAAGGDGRSPSGATSRPPSCVD